MKSTKRTGAALRLARELALPLDLVTQTMGILAKRRAGKSYLARRLVEQLHHAAQQIIVADPKGDWWGILSSRDGSRPGLPFVILGGERGHVPLEVTGGELVAKLVVEERVSVLLDLSLFRKHEVATFMQSFLEALYRLKAVERYRTPMMLVVDEADAIAPQRPQPNEARMLGAMEDIVRRGGQRGIGCTLITQRAAVLSKNVLTQVQVLVALRTISPQDLAALNAWIDVHGTAEERKTLMASLPSLPVGDAWVWSPGWPDDHGIFERIHTLPIETFDSGATPRAGEVRVEPKRVADVDLDAVRSQMAATIERAKAEDPRELRKRVAALEAELRALRAAPAPKPVHIERPVLSREDRHALERAQSVVQAFSERMQQVLSALSTAPLEQVTAPGAAGPKRTPAAPATAQESQRRGVNGRPDPERLARFAEVQSARAQPSGGALPDGERRVLIAVAQHAEGVSREQLSILTGYKRSTRDAYVQRLRTRGLLAEQHGQLVATAEGLAQLGGDFEPLPTGAALLLHWLKRLPEGERAVLAFVADRYPAHVARDEISEATAYKRSTRDAYLQRLAARRLLASARDGVVASPSLFD